jgi:hypothetical protein
VKLIKEWHRRGVPQGELGLFCVVPYHPDEDIVYFGMD